MIRDGRAAAYSLMVQLKENLTWRKYRAYLSTWNQFNKDVTRQCDNVGQEFCLIVKYEDLCLHPKSTLERVIQFLNENWSDKLLNHQNFIGSDIIVSKTEWSSHQIVNFSHFVLFFYLFNYFEVIFKIKPINSNAINDWIGKIEYDQYQINFIVPMLKRYNYSLNIKEEQNHFEDDLVAKNNEIINKNKDFYDKLARNVSDHIKAIQ